LCFASLIPHTLWLILYDVDILTFISIEYVVCACVCVCARMRVRVCVYVCVCMCVCGVCVHVARVTLYDKWNFCVSICKYLFLSLCVSSTFISVYFFTKRPVVICSVISPNSLLTLSHSYQSYITQRIFGSAFFLPSWLIIWFTSLHLHRFEFIHSFIHSLFTFHRSNFGYINQGI